MNKDEALKPALEETLEKCLCCDGSGRIPRDPDIGTYQECFVCDGSGRPIRNTDVATDQECFVCDGEGVYPKEPEQQGPWIELTDEEIEDAEIEVLKMRATDEIFSYLFARAIEAKLKEKNA